MTDVKNSAKSALKASQSRARGDYSRETLKLYFQAWSRHRTPRQLIAWLGFQRDLGYLIKHHQYTRLKALLQQNTAKRLTQGLIGQRLRQAQNLCAEYEWHHMLQPDITAGVLQTSRQKRAIHSVRTQQLQWQKEFLTYLSQQTEHGIAVVGNSGALIGQQAGPAIDASGAVIRFNQYRGDANATLDLGLRLDAWVCAPGFKGKVPDVRWIILSGPDMQFQLQNWAPLLEAIERGTPVVTIPLVHWRELVSQLQAPPSAGLLTLTWLTSQSNLKPALSVFGFGFGHRPDENVAYHLADAKHPPTPRHNWAGEARLLERNGWSTAP